MIAQGTHKAKISDYGLRETLKKDLMLTVRFVTDKDEYVNWTGLFSNNSDAATARTVKNLEVFGFTLNRAADLATGRQSGALNCDKEIEIVVIHETNEKGTTYPVVQYINEPNKFAQVTREDAVKFFSGFSFNVEKPATKDYKAATQGANVSVERFDDIPF